MISQDTGQDSPVPSVDDMPLTEVAKGIEMMNINSDLYLYATYLAAAVVVYFALANRRLIDLSLPLAIAIALLSNYTSPGLASAGIVEIVVRFVVGYAILRSVAEMTRRTTQPLPTTMRYSSQQPVIEFEEVGT